MTIREIADRMVRICVENKIDVRAAFDAQAAHLERQGANHGEIEYFLFMVKFACDDAGIDSKWTGIPPEKIRK